MIIIIIIIIHKFLFQISKVVTSEACKQTTWSEVANRGKFLVVINTSFGGLCWKRHSACKEFLKLCMNKLQSCTVSYTETQIQRKKKRTPLTHGGEPIAVVNHGQSCFSATTYIYRRNNICRSCQKSPPVHVC